ncbi:MAG: antibiotic biosynthesis monooxygenase [Chloroflexi bacterium]|nr:antibiotic biosynthesis monooxygenase [Chloroflexota bacterium]
MAYVLAATWRAREGEEEKVRQIIETMLPLSRAEPGCRTFIAHRSVEDPRVFFLYEQYDDEAAVKAHTETEHFRKHVLGDAVPRLESRERAFFVTID